MSRIDTSREYLSCNLCGDFVQSKYLYDYAECGCKAIFADGGPTQPKYGYREQDYTIIDPTTKDKTSDPRKDSR